MLTSGPEVAASRSSVNVQSSSWAASDDVLAGCPRHCSRALPSHTHFESHNFAKRASSSGSSRRRRAREEGAAVPAPEAEEAVMVPLEDAAEAELAVELEVDDGRLGGGARWLGWQVTDEKVGP